MPRLFTKISLKVAQIPKHHNSHIVRESISAESTVLSTEHVENSNVM